MCVISVLCLIVVPLPTGKNQFAVKISNNNNKQHYLPPALTFKQVGLGRIDRQFLFDMTENDSNNSSLPRKHLYRDDT
jgi:hypothetical protein